MWREVSNSMVSNSNSVPPSFTSVVPRTQVQLSDELNGSKYSNEQPPSVGSMGRAQVQLSDDQLTDTSYNNEHAASVGSMAMAALQLSDDQLIDTSYNNEQAPSMTMLDDRGRSHSAGDSCSYNAPPSLTDLAGLHASYTGSDAMETDSNSVYMSALFPIPHKSSNKMRGDDDDEASTIDPELPYIDDKLQHVLGHVLKDFEGGISAENLGEKFGGYGTFLPTYPHIRSYPH
ncbi:hypothetical protein QVD17_16157 [Tagetes erecta]|uniref:Uncharacterized protein n=1 Tax=Tagetes erecta TaxID=13708 RepID=A0AAD8P0F8_TARER|nr:hypothetical protein QVD17_16157 [Tagetes erecta]